jgi:hypothetical protein
MGWAGFFGWPMKAQARRPLAKGDIPFLGHPFHEQMPPIICGITVYFNSNDTTNYYPIEYPN